VPPTVEARGKGSRMATSQISGVLQHLRRTVLLRDGAGLTDGQLLEDYLSRRNEVALAALVRRHGPMVWGVCRRVLRNYHDAEDAFQATFLVLVRKAASIVPREMVANWLYGVAHQTALNARGTAAKKKGRERQVKEMPEPAAVAQDLWCDLQPLLDEELSHLPDKYRSVIVLCNLEGKTRKEAVRQLGVPEGTVAGWLARARTMLAKRLAQRGVTLSGGSLAMVLSQKVASAGVPTSVVSSTIKAASLFAAGQAAAAGAISVKVAALTEGMLKSMLLTKRKIATAVLLVMAVAIAGVGAGGLLRRTQAGEPPKATEKKEKPADAKAAAKQVEEAEGDNEPGFPVAPPPLQAVASAVKDASVVKGGKEVKTDVLLLTVRSDHKDDNPPPTIEQEGAKTYANTKTTYHDLNDVQAFDTKGKRIEAKKLPDLLKKKTAVLVSADGQPVDPFYLQLVKDGTVVLILQPASKEEKSK